MLLPGTRVFYHCMIEKYHQWMCVDVSTLRNYRNHGDYSGNSIIICISGSTRRSERYDCYDTIYTTPKFHTWPHPIHEG